MATKSQGKYRYSMSKVGACARTISAELLGLLPANIPDGKVPEYLRLAAREGTRHETFIREDIKEFGWNSTAKKSSNFTCEPCGREGYHVEIDTPQRLLVGHMDDINWHDDDPAQLFIGEYKALGRFVWDQLQRHGIGKHRTYDYQVSCYHEAFQNLPIFYVKKNRDTGRHAITLMDEPPTDFHTIAGRLEGIENYVDKGELAPCDMEPDLLDHWSCSAYCESEEPEIELPPHFIDATKEWRRAKFLENTVKGMMSKSRGVLAAFMDAKGLDKVTIDGVRISRVKEGIKTTYEVPDDIKSEYRVTKRRAPYIIVKDMEES